MLTDLQEVNARAERFLAQYRRRPHPRLGERTPLQVHRSRARRPLPAWARRRLEEAATRRLPLYAGRVHFIRRVETNGSVRVLNLRWQVPGAAIGQGVWVTLTLTPAKAYLDIFDAAPDAPTRQHLVRYDFPVHEPVLPHPEKTASVSRKGSITTRLRHAGQFVATQVFTMCWRFMRSLTALPRLRSLGV